MTENPSFYAIIPANVRYADITPNAKLLYGEITALTNKTGKCFATNQYFATLYKVSKTSISKWIKELVDFGFIKSEIIYKEGTKEILNRYITILNDPIEEKLNTPIKENLKDNNTSINNTSINNKKKIKEKDIFDFETLFDYWEENKKGGKYKNSESRERMLNRLKKLTNNNFDFAKQVILFCIDSGYIGFCNGNQLYYKNSFKNNGFTNENGVPY